MRGIFYLLSLGKEISPFSASVYNDLRNVTFLNVLMYLCYYGFPPLSTPLGDLIWGCPEDLLIIGHKKRGVNPPCLPYANVVVKFPELSTTRRYWVPFGDVRIRPVDVSTPTEISPSRTVNLLVGFVVPIPTM